ncbi:chromate transporter [Paenibacillus sp. FSL H8-0537]|uniref:chromate transporter n=1 Tax=Paenibacillus sp. FSL H8-0537 TaxID=2921399 RepID=UPI0031019668
MANGQNKRLGMLLQLFWIFFRIGPTTFGGGYAMMPMIERETVQKRQWMDEREWTQLISLAGSAPGGVGVNAAAMVGYRQAGAAGAVIAIVGITLPTLLLVLLLGLFMRVFGDHPKLVAALKGINGAVIALMVMAAYRMARAALFDIATTFVAVVTLTVLLFTAINPIYVVMAGLLGGIVFTKGKELLGMKVLTEKATVRRSSSEIEYYI